MMEKVSERELQEYIDEAVKLHCDGTYNGFDSFSTFVHDASPKIVALNVKTAMMRLLNYKGVLE